MNHDPTGRNPDDESDSSHFNADESSSNDHPDPTRQPNANAWNGSFVAKSGNVLVERFELKKALSSGGEAFLWEAVDRALDRLVVVKLFKNGIKRTVELAEIVQRWGKIEFPECPRLYEYYPEHSPPFIVMQHMPGEDLRSRIPQVHAKETKHGARADFSRLLSAVADVADTLSKLHAIGLVHSDVDPINIHVDGEHGILLDFTTLRPSKGAEKAGHAPHFAGHRATRAPEVRDGAAVTGEVDLESLRRTLFWILYGERPAVNTPVNWAKPKFFATVFRNWDDFTAIGDCRHRCKTGSDLSKAIRDCIDGKPLPVGSTFTQLVRNAWYHRTIVSVTLMVIFLVIACIGVSFSMYTANQSAQFELVESERKGSALRVQNADLTQGLQRAVQVRDEVSQFVLHNIYETGRPEKRRSTEIPTLRDAIMEVTELLNEKPELTKESEMLLRGFAGKALRSIGKRDESVDQLRQSIALGEECAKGDVWLTKAAVQFEIELILALLGSEAGDKEARTLASGLLDQMKDEIEISEEHIEVWIALGDACLKLKDITAALNAYLSALSHREQTGTLEDQAKVRVKIGRVYVQLGDDLLAADAFKRALKDAIAAKLPPDDALIVVIGTDMIAIQFRKCEFETAKATCQELLPLMEERFGRWHHNTTAFRTYFMYALINGGQLDDAEQQSVAVLKALDEPGVTAERRVAWQNAIGTLYVHQQRFENAATTLSRALESGQQLAENHPGRIAVRLNCGHLFLFSHGKFFATGVCELEDLDLDYGRSTQGDSRLRNRLLAAEVALISGDIEKANGYFASAGAERKSLQCCQKYLDDWLRVLDFRINVASDTTRKSDQERLAIRSTMENRRGNVFYDYFCESLDETSIAPAK